MVQTGKQNYRERCLKFFNFIFKLLPNVAKSSNGRSPLWLNHKIAPPQVLPPHITKLILKKEKKEMK